MTICGEKSIVNHGETVSIYATLKCKRWTCPDCITRRLSKLKKECRQGHPTTFLTLTSRRSADADPEEAARDLVHAWKIIRDRIKRLRHCKKVEFMAVFEQTDAGWPHLHILARMPFVPQKLISDWMAELTNSPIVDIRKVRSTKQAAAYVAKYVSKAPARYAGTKRYWRSLDYLKKDPRPKSPFFPEGYGWNVLKQHISVIIRQWRQEGLHVTQDGPWWKVSWAVLTEPP